MAVREEITLGGGPSFIPRMGRMKPQHDAHPPTARHPLVPTRQLALSERLRALQILKGLFVEVDGEKFALPIDSFEDRTVFLGQKMWVDGPAFPHRVGVKAKAPRSLWQQKTLAWLRDNVSENIPPRYYRATLGHDLHVATWGDLYAKHWHAGWASPFDSGAGESVRGPIDPTFDTYLKTHWPASDDLGGGLIQLEHQINCRLGPQCPAWSENRGDARARLQRGRGFVENLGWLSGAKVTSAFVSEEIDELVSTTGTEYADFDFHEVGTSSTAESNAHTALQTTTSIARATGTPTDADPIYRSVATITADTSETWQEHGIFNNSTSVAMMDRNLTGGQAVVSTDQVQYTYELTKNPEA